MHPVPYYPPSGAAVCGISIAAVCGISIAAVIGVPDMIHFTTLQRCVRRHRGCEGASDSDGGGGRCRSPCPPFASASLDPCPTHAAALKRDGRPMHGMRTRPTTSDTLGGRVASASESLRRRALSWPHWSCRYCLRHSVVEVSHRHSTPGNCSKHKACLLPPELS